MLRMRAALTGRVCARLAARGWQGRYDAQSLHSVLWLTGAGLFIIAALALLWHHENGGAIDA